MSAYKHLITEIFVELQKVCKIFKNLLTLIREDATVGLVPPLWNKNRIVGGDSMERFKEFGEFLKYKRKEMKVTVRELAFTLNTRASRITEYENGSRRPPDGDFLPELADALELNQSEKDLMYDLAGKSRGTVPQDIAYYIMDKGYIYDALRSAMRSNAGEKEWRSVRDAFRMKG